jgi:hypothetical protein
MVALTFMKDTTMELEERAWDLNMDALTKAWTPLRYHPVQARLWRTRARFVGVAAGRGSGKTELARRRVVRYLCVRKPWPDPLYFYALPTRDQAKRVAWNALKDLVPKHWISGISETELTVTTVFGSKLFLLGLDKPERAEGVQWDGGVIDESSDQRPGVFDRNLLPALSHRDPWCWRIGVPKRSGPGAIEFREFCEDAAEEFYTWPSADILTADQIAYARKTLDAKDYSEQFEANWEDAGGRIFYAFSAANISDRACYRPDLPLTVGCDFNVDPMCWELGHKFPDHLETFDTLFIRDCNTPAALDELHRRYGQHMAGWQFFLDASAKARKTSASASDLLHIRNDERFKDRRVYATAANPPVADRFASCNALFKNAAGEVRYYVHPRCKPLIKDLESRQYSQGTRLPDDYGDLGHMSDALGYRVHSLFPLRPIQLGGVPEIAA